MTDPETLKAYAKHEGAEWWPETMLFLDGDCHDVIKEAEEFRLNDADQELAHKSDLARAILAAAKEEE